MHTLDPYMLMALLDMDVYSRQLTDRIIKVIQHRKGLYDFYYTLVTLTTRYKMVLAEIGNFSYLRNMI